MTKLTLNHTNIPLISPEMLDKPYTPLKLQKKTLTLTKITREMEKHLKSTRLHLFHDKNYINHKIDP